MCCVEPLCLCLSLTLSALIWAQSVAKCAQLCHFKYGSGEWLGVWQSARIGLAKLVGCQSLWLDPAGGWRVYLAGKGEGGVEDDLRRERDDEAAVHRLPVPTHPS